MRAPIVLLLALAACSRAPAPDAKRETINVAPLVPSSAPAPPPPPPPAPTVDVDAASGACRSAADCPEGELCCRSRLDLHGQSCMQPDTVDGEACMLQACLDAGGAPCPSGQACRDGFCRPSPHERATCNGSLCPADKPFCKWNGTKGVCASGGGLACTKKSDCGPNMHCCTSDDPFGPVTTSECARDCAPPETVGLCEKDKDCPPFFATGADHGLRPVPCARKPGAGSPPWVRLCGAAIP